MKSALPEKEETIPCIYKSVGFSRNYKFRKLDYSHDLLGQLTTSLFISIFHRIRRPDEFLLYLQPRISIIHY
jgi:hypothetical protein